MSKRILIFEHDKHKPMAMAAYKLIGVINIKKYILFDLDGTVIDPMLGITKAVKYSLSKFDITVKKL